MISMSNSPSNAGGEDRNRPSRGEEPTLLSVPDTPRSVLLVGQDPRMNQSLSTLMTEEGYGVRIACHALEAIQTAEAEPFGAVVLTCALPGQDAATLSRHLTHVAPDLPVIVCAGRAAGVEESAAAAQGAFAILHRPDDPHHVRATLRSAMLLHTLTRKVRKLELSLYQSQERLHAVVEAAPDAIVLADQDGRILSWNKAAEAMFCYTVEEALGQPLTIMMPERYREAHEEGLRRVRASGRSTVIGRTIELSGLRHDGSEFPLELSLASWTSEGSTFFSGIIRDITERKRDADRLVRINQTFLEFSNDHSENIARLTALCGELLGGTCALYSYLDGGLLHSVARWRTLADFKAIRKPDGLICPQVIARGRPDPFVVSNLQKTAYAKTNSQFPSSNLQTYVGQAVRRGQRYVGALSVMFDRDFLPNESDQRLLGIMASAIGVEEERKKADQALRQAYDDTELILASLPSAILIVDEHQLVVWANALASQYLSGGQQVIVGSSLSDILPAEEVRRCQLLFGLEGLRAESGYWKQDRELKIQERTYRYRCFPIAMRGSKRPHIGFSFWDLSEEKQLQDQLTQTEKLAGLGTMVSGMAHEINNPAQAILGMAEMILDEEVPEDVKGYARDIAGYAQHLAAVVRDFASYARASSREGAAELDLNQRLVEAVKMVRRGPHFGNIDVITHFEDLPPFRAKRTEIDQVFVNLVGNAAHAMKGKGSLTLRTSWSGAKIIVSLADSGCGIPKSLRQKIFDPFFTTKDPGTGTGLGLSIVQKIVSKYGGNITVDSEEGAGTTFTIEFPVANQTTGGA